MKKIILLLIGIACLGSACGKKKVPTIWKFGDQSFTTKNIEVTTGKRGAYLSCKDPIRFSIYFYLTPYLFTQYDLPLATQANTLGTAQMTATDGRYSYWPSVHNTNLLQAREVNGKACYTLAPTWFVNTTNPSDSVLIEGNFNEP